MPTGQKIKQSRVQQGITQQELALAANINLRTLQRIENEEVIPRRYTLTLIARALQIEESELMDFHSLGNDLQNAKQGKARLVWLHLSGLLFVPALLIWFFEKEHDQAIKYHGADVINFQLSMLAILLPCLVFAGLPQLVALFTLLVILLNTIRVILGKSYYYPLAIRIIKP